jgi:hypothetical protein
MQDTKTIFRILTNTNEVFEVICTPEQAPETLAYYENLYYKSRIETFWVNDVEFEEPSV